jgi:Domain of unknown function (DUF4145)
MLILQQELLPMGFDMDPPWRVYPPQDRQLSQLIPESLREAHDEARKCFHAKSWIGAVAMSGRTLEGACKLHGVTKGILQDKLEEMKKRGLIDGRLWEWAETLRGVRNAASHFNDEPVTKQDAEDALAYYSEALLDYLYVLKARFEEMKKRRTPAIEPAETAGAIE